MKREGFTLIELLMVIVVILLMIALILPACQRSRQQAKTLKCRSNLRQLALDLIIYHDENNGTFPNAINSSMYTRQKNPPSGGHAGDASQDRKGWWWFNYLKTDYSRKNFKKKSVIWCPSRDINNRRLERNVLCANYAVNQSICKSISDSRKQTEFIGKPLGMSDIQRPSETLLIFDCGYSMIKWWHVTNIPPEPLGNKIGDHAYIPGLKINEEKKKWPGLEGDAINGRHPKKTINAGFPDGHVDGKGADELFVEKTDAGYNLFPLWRPTKTCDD
jgi:prepilin-type N-terminal cleavage/methylation domain-containing protein/prepilin-type processing-associated H-X9-DG protein